MLLILIDNQLARTAAGDTQNLVPQLRAAFAVGSHYSYHQVEGTKPRGFDYIVGDVTITLARMIAKAQPGQILVGNFLRPLDPLTQMMDAIMFLVRSEKVLARLEGVAAGDHPLKAVRSYATGGRVEGRSLPMVKYLIEDKHGYQHEMFNVRAFVQREDVEPLEFGLSSEKLGDFPGRAVLYEVPALGDGPRMVQTAD